MRYLFCIRNKRLTTDIFRRILAVVHTDLTYPKICVIVYKRGFEHFVFPLYLCKEYCIIRYLVSFLDHAVGSSDGDDAKLDCKRDSYDQ